MANDFSGLYIFMSSACLDKAGEETMKKEWLENLAIAAALALFLSLYGCVRMFTAETEAYYQLPNGEKLYYKSDKNQENFTAHLDLDPKGQLKGLDVKTTAVTPEAAIAAAMQSLADFMKQLGPLIDMATKAAAAGAGS